ncbi:MAG: tetratricopeptide repeat protein [Woeseiaceae bacterium]|nr:tetratricopeptide repeat protein [Woeseiaceae bacterium]
MRISFADCIVDPARRELRRDGQLVPIEPRIYELMMYLVEHRERAVGKDELQNAVWGTVVTDSAMTRAVMKLRKAIGDRTDSVGIVKTVPRFGYRFAAEVVREDNSAQELPNDGDSDARSGIAVLPLMNMSDDPDNDYFADGIAEEILNALTKIPDLRVASRTSSFTFRNSTKTLREIADVMNVETILEGSVRKSGKRVRITMQLIDAKTDTHLWSEIYDRELADIFEVQAEIAREVVSSILGSSVIDIPVYVATEDPKAYEYYLQGRQLSHLWDRGCLQRAGQLFRRAIEIDPDYARAWAGLADMASMTYMWWDQSDDLLREAEASSQRALDLAPELAESHTAKAFALTLSRDFSAATAAFERAIEIDPLLYEARYLYGRAKFAEGDYEEAARQFEEAGRLRSDDYQSVALASTAMDAAKDKDAAQAYAAEAVRRAERAVSVNPEDTRAWTLGACNLAEIGEYDRGVEWVERALEIAPEDVGVLHNAGCFFSAGGDVDRALDLFERRLAIADIYQEWIDNDVDFDAIRQHPRFIAMLEKRRQQSQERESE